jgi:hypothetical protein
VGPLGGYTGSSAAGVTQQGPGSVTGGGVTGPGDTAVQVTPSAAPEHTTGGDPQLDDGMDVTSVTSGVTSGVTSVTGDTRSSGAGGTGANAAGSNSGVGAAPADHTPPSIGVVAPVG